MQCDIGDRWTGDVEERPAEVVQGTARIVEADHAVDFAPPAFDDPAGAFEANGLLAFLLLQRDLPELGSKQCAFEPGPIIRLENFREPALALPAPASPFQADGFLALADVNQRLALESAAPDKPICLHGLSDFAAH